MKKMWWLAGALFVLDRLTKLWAEYMLAPLGALQAWPGVFQFTYARNTGMALSILTGNNWLLSLFNVGVLALVLVLYFKVKTLPGPVRVGLILILLGGLGNLIDRWVYGYVIDFIELTFIRFAIFNVADIMVTAGAALAMIGLLIPEKGATDA